MIRSIRDATGFQSSVRIHKGGKGVEFPYTSIWCCYKPSFSRFLSIPLQQNSPQTMHLPSHQAEWEPHRHFLWGKAGRSSADTSTLSQPHFTAPWNLHDSWMKLSRVDTTMDLQWAASQHHRPVWPWLFLQGCPAHSGCSLLVSDAFQSGFCFSLWEMLRLKPQVP